MILWDTTRVWKILTAYVYTGAMVLGKSQRLISGKSISRTVPKGQQYITEGTHEAIVSREEFEKAQLVINNRNKVVMGSVDFPLTQGIKEKLYGDYADEILTREDFLNYNELYSKRIEEYNRKITELEAERQNLQTAPNAYPFLDVYRKYRKLEEITRPMVVELIEKIEVYEGNRVEITFQFQDEIADLLEELHQKQMGQREVSA